MFWNVRKNVYMEGFKVILSFFLKIVRFRTFRIYVYVYGFSFTSFFRCPQKQGFFRTGGGGGRVVKKTFLIDGKSGV